jgi:hypothetical protein
MYFKLMIIIIIPTYLYLRSHKFVNFLGPKYVHCYLMYLQLGSMIGLIMTL